MSFPHILSPSTGLSPQAEFVAGDLLALASHMQRCARSHGPMFALRTALQTGRALAAGRIVTVGCLACGLALTVSAMV